MRKYEVKKGDRLYFNTAFLEGKGLYEVVGFFKKYGKKIAEMIKVGKRGKKLSRKYKRNRLNHPKREIESNVNSCSKKYGKGDIQRIEPKREVRKNGN